MTQLTEEQQERVKQELKRRLAIARGIEIESGSAKDRAFVDGGIAAFELLLDDLSLLDSDSQAAGDDLTSSDFTFGPCAHSMVKPDCPSCCQSHAWRMEDQLRKLTASTALPIRERVEKAVREQMEHCHQVYKGVPPTVEDWIGGALHYVMWGLERDVPLKPDAATAMRDKCVAKVKETEFIHHVDCATAIQKQSICNCFAATIKTRLIAALESLTLDQVKPEKQK